MNARTNHVTKIRRTCMAILIKEGAIYDSNIKNKKKVFCHLVNHTSWASVMKSSNKFWGYACSEDSIFAWMSSILCIPDKLKLHLN